jgi:hypothetical protein
MKGTSCLVLLIGAHTAGRPWVEYEIKKAWEDRKGVVGIYIHNLKDLNEKQSPKGRNPFDTFSTGDGTSKKSFSTIVKAYDPPSSDSQKVYKWISDHIEDAVAEAITIRAKN